MNNFNLFHSILCYQFLFVLVSRKGEQEMKIFKSKQNRAQPFCFDRRVICSRNQSMEASKCPNFWDKNLERQNQK